jgi:hypothetical protein
VFSLLRLILNKTLWGIEKMDLGQKLVELTKKHVDVPGLVDGILDEILEETIKEVVAKSETIIDDVVVNALYPVLETVIKSKIHEAWAKV